MKKKYHSAHTPVTTILMLLFCFAGFQTNFCLVNANENEAKNAVKKVRIFGPVYSPVEEVDGNPFPVDVKALAEQLQSNIPDLVHEEADNFYTLEISDESDLNRIFFALQIAYPNNIACDTATLLTGYHLKGKKIALNDLHEFLVARASFNEDEEVEMEHPYHDILDKMRSELGIKYFNNESKTLDKILEKVNDRAIVNTESHIAVIRKTGETTYITSAWNNEEGIHFRELIYDGKNDFHHPVWEKMDIQAYNMLPPFGENNLGF